MAKTDFDPAFRNTLRRLLDEASNELRITPEHTRTKARMAEHLLKAAAEGVTYTVSLKRVALEHGRSELKAA